MDIGSDRNGQVADYTCRAIMHLLCVATKINKDRIISAEDVGYMLILLTQI